MYPGCESSESLREQKKCFGDSVNKLIAENFNTGLASNLDLEGIQKMYARFTIDEEGTIEDIKVRAPHPALAREVERVIKLIPALQPASLEGISVAIPYVLPIVFRVQ
jgi:protein TonB